MRPRGARQPPNPPPPPVGVSTIPKIPGGYVGARKYELSQTNNRVVTIEADTVQFTDFGTVVFRRSLYVDGQSKQVVVAAYPPHAWVLVEEVFDGKSGDVG